MTRFGTGIPTMEILNSDPIEVQALNIGFALVKISAGLADTNAGIDIWEKKS